MEGPRFIAWRSSDRFHLVSVAVLVAVLVGLITLLNVVYSVTHVVGESMLPVLRPRDTILVTRGYEAPRVGDIICFLAAEEGGRTVEVVKRVVAVPGDSIDIVGDVAYVNGKLSEAAPTAIVGTDAERLRPMTVPDGSVYVLGDNRPISLDSRFTGVVPLSSVIGKAVAVVYPLPRIRRIDE